MQLPTPLLRNKPNTYKNNFGHALIIAGSKSMLGAGCLSALSSLRAGAGLVTLGIPQSLNSTAQKKVSNEIMTLPLKETKNQTISIYAFGQLKNILNKFNAIAIGPGLTTNPSTKKFVLKIIQNCEIPIVIDADGLNCIKDDLYILNKNNNAKILTPHIGEMLRLLNINKKPLTIDDRNTRQNIINQFINKYNCTIVLKGKNSIIADKKNMHINKTGNSGLATAGTGDVLTGIITALLAQGVDQFNAAKFGTYLHGLAADIAIKQIPRASLIASDVINSIPKALKQCLKNK